jgi:hypothetical protein
LTRDPVDEIADGHPFHLDDGMKAVPEAVFQADAGSPFLHDHGSFPAGI